MGGCFGGRKFTKKPTNRWTKLGGMLQIYSIHTPGRRPWPKNRPRHHGESRRHTASLMLQLGTRRRLSGQLHALAALPLEERIALTEQGGGKA
jgi:hypothetical protein